MGRGQSPRIILNLSLTSVLLSGLWRSQGHLWFNVAGSLGQEEWPGDGQVLTASYVFPLRREGL